MQFCVLLLALLGAQVSAWVPAGSTSFPRLTRSKVRVKVKAYDVNDYNMIKHHSTS